jgi:hypothetical protein
MRNGPRLTTEMILYFQKITEPSLVAQRLLFAMHQIRISARLQATNQHYASRTWVQSSARGPVTPTAGFHAFPESPTQMLG